MLISKVTRMTKYTLYTNYFKVILLLTKSIHNNYVFNNTWIMYVCMYVCICYNNVHDKDILQY